MKRVEEAVGEIKDERTFKKMKIDKSFYFIDSCNKQYFLFQLLNFGGSDNLKFIFNTKGEGTGIVYSPKGPFPSKEDIQKLYGEITYHNDGKLHCKLPKDREDDKTNYVNNFQRKPIDQIREFEPIIKHTVAYYDLCKKSKAKNKIFLPKNDFIFNQESFECVICLGNLEYSNPPSKGPNEIIFRVNDVAENLDLILWIYKSSYKPPIVNIPNTNIKFISKGNITEIVEKRAKTDKK